MRVCQASSLNMDFSNARKSPLGNHCTCKWKLGKGPEAFADFDLQALAKPLTTWKETQKRLASLLFLASRRKSIPFASCWRNWPKETLWNPTFFGNVLANFAVPKTLAALGLNPKWGQRADAYSPPHPGLQIQLLADGLKIQSWEPLGIGWTWTFADASGWWVAFLHLWSQKTLKLSRIHPWVEHKGHPRFAFSSGFALVTRLLYFTALLSNISVPSRSTTYAALYKQEFVPKIHLLDNKHRDITTSPPPQKKIDSNLCRTTSRWC